MHQATSPVDVVVVTYNPGPTIEGFLGSVAGAGGAASVTVVDNASTDDAAPRAAKRAKATFIQTGRNAGYGAAANRGAALGSAIWVLISNADIVLGAGAIAALVEVGQRDPSIGAVGPLVRELDGSVYPSARPLPGLLLGAGHALFGRVWPSNPWSRRYRPLLVPGSADREVGWLSGSCVLVRRDAWERIGGFDEDFFMFFEDVDLGRRLGRAGWRNVWTSSAEVTHVGGHSWRADPGPMLAAHHASAERYVRLTYPHWWQAPVRAAVSRGLAARLRRELATAAGSA